MPLIYDKGVHTFNVLNAHESLYELGMLMRKLSASGAIVEFGRRVVQWSVSQAFSIMSKQSKLGMGITVFFPLV